MLTFTQATPTHLPIIFAWLDKPHVKEFWDNSAEHRQDIEAFAQGRPPVLPYNFHYWVGSSSNEPFCFLLTSEMLTNQDDLSPLHRQHLSKTGKTFGIDFCIGNENFLGKGLAAPVLRAFAAFFKNQIEPQVDTFFIDPDQNNPRAQRVYEKAGFVEVGEFAVEQGFFAGHQSRLMVLKETPIN